MKIFCQVVRFLSRASGRQLLILAVAALFHQSAFAQPPVSLIQVRHPETGQLYDLQYQPSTLEERARFHPRNLDTSWRKQIWNSTKTVGGHTAEIARQSWQMFPYDAGMFYGAGFLVSLRQMAFAPENHPVSIDQFIATQITDPVAHASFFVFMMSYRGSDLLLDAAFQRAGYKGDPRKLAQTIDALVKSNPELVHQLKMGPNGYTPAQTRLMREVREQAERLSPPPKSHALFSRIQFSSALAVGFLASSIFADLLADPDISYCFGAKFWNPEVINREIAKRGVLPSRACETAYERWVTNGKITDYAPAVTAAVMTALTLSVGLPKTLNWAKSFARPAERVIPIVMRSLQMGRFLGETLPQTRLVVGVAHAYAFLEISHVLTDALTIPYEIARKAPNLRRLEAELATIPQKPDVGEICQTVFERSFDEKTLGAIPYSQLKLFLEQNTTSCREGLPMAQPELVRQYSQAMSDWRSVWFAPSERALSGWQEKVKSVQGRYDIGFDFYQGLLAAIEKTEGQDFVFVQNFKDLIEPTEFEGRLRRTLQALQKFEQSDSRDISKAAVSLRSRMRKFSSQDDLRAIQNQIRSLKGDVRLSLASDSWQKLVAELERDWLGIRVLDPATAFVIQFRKKLENEKQSSFAKRSGFFDMIHRVAVRDEVDYALTSAVCGPMRKNEVLRHSPGRAIDFNLPSLVRTSVPRICTDTRLAAPDRSRITVDDLPDLVALIREHRKIGSKSFEVFWKNMVTEPTQTTLAILMKEYEALLAGTVIPAIQKDSSRGILNSVEREMIQMQAIIRRLIPAQETALHARRLELQKLTQTHIDFLRGRSLEMAAIDSSESSELMTKLKLGANRSEKAKEYAKLMGSVAGLQNAWLELITQTKQRLQNESNQADEIEALVIAANTHNALLQMSSETHAFRLTLISLKDLNLTPQAHQPKGAL